VIADGTRKQFSCRSDRRSEGTRRGDIKIGTRGKKSGRELGSGMCGYLQRDFRSKTVELENEAKLLKKKSKIN
jgi:hypothetical protein